MKSKQGISLIVLVITIIVMIILAASVVITLSNSGIINKSNEATNKTNRKQIEQLAMLAWSEAFMDGARTEEEFKNALDEALKDVDTSEYEIIVTDKGVIVTNKEDNETVPKIMLSQETIIMSIESDSPKEVILTATTENITEILSWSTNNENVATVEGNDKTAIVTLKGEGTAIITVTANGVSQMCTVKVEEVQVVPLGSLITNPKEDYGKTINYSVTVTGMAVDNGTYNNWQIFYHNDDYVYLILADKLPTKIKLNKGTTVTSLSTKTVSTLETGKNTLLDLYNIFRVGNKEKYTLIDKKTIDGTVETMYNSQAVAQLITDYTVFANTNDYGSNVVGAIGGPTLELFAASWNTKGNTPTIELTLNEYGYKLGDVEVIFADPDNLYVKEEYVYCMASPASAATNSVRTAGMLGIGAGGYYSELALRPVVCLKSSILAKVGTGEYDFELVK